MKLLNSEYRSKHILVSQFAKTAPLVVIVSMNILKVGSNRIAREEHTQLPNILHKLLFATTTNITK